MARVPEKSLDVYLISRKLALLQRLKWTLQSSNKFHVFAIRRSVDSIRIPEGKAVFVVDADDPRVLLTQSFTSLSESNPLERSLIIGDLNVEQVCELLSMGYRGFLSARAIDTRLRDAIISVSRGHLVVPRATLEHYVAYSQACLNPRLANERKTLTPRQRELVQLLERGSTNKEIGCALQITENTVKFHMAKLFSKLGVHDRHGIQDAIRRAGEGGELLCRRAMSI